MCIRDSIYIYLKKWVVYLHVVSFLAFCLTRTVCFQGFEYENELCKSNFCVTEYRYDTQQILQTQRHQRLKLLNHLNTNTKTHQYTASKSRRIDDQVDIEQRNENTYSHISLKCTDCQVKYLLACLLYTSPSPRDGLLSRMPSSA
eukprot:TRINITY_DN597_c0_g1_i4.p1 TRINITY_DN597_c0_g1~~TRINITY_DN597_c0_g1_i4.p1  ORF type:complete len:145 (+),score=5.78 TRINITY_DN597_c0_g1_i4:71-505(+)